MTPSLNCQRQSFYGRKAFDGLPPKRVIFTEQVKNKIPQGRIHLRYFNIFYRPHVIPLQKLQISEVTHYHCKSEGVESCRVLAFLLSTLCIYILITHQLFSAWQGCIARFRTRTRFQTGFRSSLVSELTRKWRSWNRNWPGMQASAGLGLVNYSSQVQNESYIILLKATF